MMRIVRCVGLMCLLGATGASAGEIVGIVTGKGPVSAAVAGGSGAYASMRYKFAEKVDYDHLRDFIVYIDQPVAGAVNHAEIPTVTQRNVAFEPHLLPIMVGAKVRWPNADEIYHNVFSMSETNTFDLGLYTKDGRVPLVPFDQVGRVDVFCGIHAKMHCIILVLPSPCFALADTQGRYRIKEVPAGSYPLKAWHERLPAQTKTVVVPAQGEVTVDFTLGLAELPKY